MRDFNSIKDIQEQDIYDKVVFYDNPNKSQFNQIAFKGKSVLLILLDNEKNLLEGYYDINSSEVSFPKGKIFNIQKKIEDAVSRKYELYDSATSAYKAYVRNYANSELNLEKRRITNLKRS